MSTNPKTIAALALGAATLLLFILMSTPWLNSLPNGPLILGVVVVLFEITVPIEILKYLKIRVRDFNIYAHRIDTLLDIIFPPYGIKKLFPDFPGIVQELVVLLKTTVIVFIPYIIGYWAFFNLLAIKDNLELIISFNLPPQLWYEIIMQIFAIALPEELFYRGFLQSALLRKWPNRTFIAVLPLGRAVVVTNLFFALGHVVSAWSPTRLLTFFPGLIFSYLTYKNKSIFSAILFHALCNLLGIILYSSVFLK